jgi:hypothetical protein
MLTVELTYFKDNGKYYSGGNFNTHLDDLFSIWECIRQMPKHPGLSTNWFNSGFILVEVPKHPSNHPILLLSTDKRFGGLPNTSQDYIKAPKEESDCLSNEQLQRIHILFEEWFSEKLSLYRDKIC